MPVKGERSRNISYNFIAKHPTLLRNTQKHASHNKSQNPEPPHPIFSQIRSQKLINPNQISVKLQIMLFPHLLPILLLLLTLLTALTLAQSQPSTQCCTKLQNKQCLACPAGTHLYRGNCIVDVGGCVLYVGGFDCVGCGVGFVLRVEDGDCVAGVLGAAGSKDFVDEVINIRDPVGPNALAYTLSVDFLKSIQPQLLNAQPIGSIFRTYKNLSTQLTIQFQTPLSLYTATLHTNLDQFIFQLISFSPIAVPRLTSNKIEILDRKNKGHAELVRLVEEQARGINGGLGGLLGGRVMTGGDGSFGVSLVYGGNGGGEEWEVTALVGKDKAANGLVIRQTGFAVKADVPALVFTTFDPASTQDFYLIALDFLVSQLPKYQSQTPTKSQVSLSKQTTFYKLTYTLPDSSSSQILISLNTNTLILKLEKQTQLTLPLSLMPVKVYERIRKQDIFLDFQFILLYEAVNKEFRDKYRDAAVRILERFQDVGVAEYRVYFQGNATAGGAGAVGLWLVQGEINRNSFVVSKLKETSITAIPNITITGTNTTTTTNTTNTTTNTTNTTLPDSITASLTSMQRASPQDLLTPDFQQVLDTLAAANIKQLKTNKLVAVYMSSTSFTKNYNLYYREGKSPHFYQAKVTKDGLRKKVYIISFTQIV